MSLMKAQHWTVPFGSAFMVLEVGFHLRGTIVILFISWCLDWIPGCLSGSLQLQNSRPLTNQCAENGVQVLFSCEANLYLIQQGGLTMCKIHITLVYYLVLIPTLCDTFIPVPPFFHTGILKHSDVNNLYSVTWLADKWKKSYFRDRKTVWT